MPSGIVALLDDVAVIARAAAASADDIGVAAGQAGSKAAGVVIDDAAVTPSYVTGFTPDRELPIIFKITKGSLINKLLILLPGALLLSEFLPWAIIPILMLGGCFLSYEGAEKVMEKLGGQQHGKTLENKIEDPVQFEKERVSGAIRTDLILSAEIMAITLSEVADETLVTRAGVLAIVGVLITVLVLGHSVSQRPSSRAGLNSVCRRPLASSSFCTSPSTVLLGGTYFRSKISYCSSPAGRITAP